MKNQKFMALAAITLAAIVWGLSFLSIKVVIDVVSPMALALVRFIVAIVVLFIFKKSMNENTKLDKKDIPRIALGGLLGVTLYFYFQNTGVKMISASAASIIVAVAPIFALIGEAIVFKTKLTGRKILSVMISFIGVYFIVGFSLKNSSDSNAVMGYLMMFGAVISWVIYGIITKPLFEKYSQLTIIYYQYIFGTLFIAPFGIMGSVQWGLVNNGVILNIIFLGAVCSAAAYYLNAYALDHLGVAVTSVFLNLIPVVTIIGSFFLLSETIGLYQVLGGTLVIFSVFLANIEKKTNSKEIILTE